MPIMYSIPKGGNRGKVLPPPTGDYTVARMGSLIKIKYGQTTDGGQDQSTIVQIKLKSGDVVDISAATSGGRKLTKTELQEKYSLKVGKTKGQSAVAKLVRIPGK